MSCPRPPPLDLTLLPPTPPATPNKQHPLISTSPSPTSWTPREPKSVRIALPAPQAHVHKSKTSHQTAWIVNPHYHRKSKPKPKTKKILTKLYNALLNGLIARYYALVQSLCEPELSSSRFIVVDDNLVVSESRGILAPSPSPVPPVPSASRYIQAQTQKRKAVQVIRDEAHALIFKPLTAIAPVLTLPILPSQQVEKEVRKVLKRAKRALKALEGYVGSEGFESGQEKIRNKSESEIGLNQDVDVDMGMDRELGDDAGHGDGDGMKLDREGLDDGVGEHGSRAGEQLEAGEAETMEGTLGLCTWS
ncbi:hypothetical protein QBC32DRAFT_208247 [Pseudoneurospora amorphoporcata]|uniref:Uncharacterized protein n=1 Tax=Pseudoneurospora amorphoporcata TaxID=241081 RepID=A0AAN6P042_9PEZI|nr:hypothetical protein QBC32DRAFT_208247 [Pseudoneurospora amorphoporcata]